MYYPITSEEFGSVYPIKPDGSEGRWRVSKIVADELMAAGLIIFDQQKDGRIEPYRLIPAGTERHTAYGSILDNNDVKTTAHGTSELSSIMARESFPYPKPSSLVQELISLPHGNDALILDSFAGSGTTAQAVLALNTTDNGNRRFILVECEDYANTITAERVRRVIEGVPDAKDAQLREGLGGSFTYCTLGEPLDLETMLTGDSLPAYSELAVYLLYTAAGISVDSTALEPRGDGWFFGDENTDYYLFYEPSIKWLQSNGAVFTEDQAKQIREANPGRSAVVFAAGKFIGQRELSGMNITFCQLPYELHRVGG